LKNKARLLRYLRLKRVALPSAQITTWRGQGLSNKTYLLDSGKEHFILRVYRDRSGKTIPKEMNMYQTLSEMGVPVPRVYVADVDGILLGRPFLLTQKLEGEKFSSLIKRGAGEDFVEALASSLHRLHSVDPRILDLELPRRTFRDEVSDIKILAGMLLTLSIAPVSLYLVHKALSEISDIHGRGNRLALLHGDCDPSNVIYHDGFAYLIDVEDAYIGDPAFDLGYAYRFVRFEAWPRPQLAENFINVYQNLHGKIASLEAYKKLAALKLAVSIRFLLGIDALSLLLVGFEKKAGLIALRKYFSAFFNYCLTYAEKGKAELEI
jgi:aminoglycoside phosphotransferase (APT) family kinase protein